ADISEFVDESGVLKWNAPEGNWEIVQFGMTSTQVKNHPASPEGHGLEIDKMNHELVKEHFDAFIGKLLERIPGESKSALKYVIADSYETGSQNWTDGYKQKFEQRFGYNPVKYLPVLTGQVVGSVEQSERFLWDLRRSVATDIAYEYVGGLKKLANENNLKLWLENYGHWGYPSEFLMYGGQSDMVSGEYWNEGRLGNIECKASSSAAHIYGKPITSAEAFTSSRKSYVRYPEFLKARGDWSFTEGINHIVLHLYIHQPYEDKIPGVNARFSTEFNRHNTWFKKSKAWIDYLRRCQHLLQQGKYVADVCYFIGEDAPKMTGATIPGIPKGYSFDYINGEVIKERLSSQDGKLTLPDGMNYKLMVLPPVETIRPEILEKIEKLVNVGCAIYGPKPIKSPSLSDYPNCDNSVQNLANKLWGKNYTDGRLEKKYGNGMVFNDMPLDSVLSILGIRRDVRFTKHSFLWLHRKMPGMEIYFVSNQDTITKQTKATFRITGMKPQLWDANTGEIKALPDYTIANGEITVPLLLEPLQSQFVVFTNESSEEVKKVKNNFTPYNSVITLPGNWELKFHNTNFVKDSIYKVSELKSWTNFSNEAVRFYSGTATYKTTYNLPDDVPTKEILINLGRLSVVADVKINGTSIGTTWVRPYRLNTNGLLKAGENTIEVEVTNQWRNRMLYEKNHSPKERFTWYLFDDIIKGDKPLKAGLLGPVTLEIFE
ncbi:MAG: glycoside hydrolase family 2, partial [Bacteroidales bacterium]|nr:glycoside hydrolase family 2 [Bacteroidales bacterium]